MSDVSSRFLVCLLTPATKVCAAVKACPENSALLAASMASSKTLSLYNAISDSGIQQPTVSRRRVWGISSNLYRNPELFTGCRILSSDIAKDQLFHLLVADIAEVGQLRQLLVGPWGDHPELSVTVPELEANGQCLESCHKGP